MRRSLGCFEENQVTQMNVGQAPDPVNFPLTRTKTRQDKTNTKTIQGKDKASAVGTHENLISNYSVPACRDAVRSNRARCNINNESVCSNKLPQIQLFFPFFVGHYTGRTPELLPIPGLGGGLPSSSSSPLRGSGKRRGGGKINRGGYFFSSIATAFRVKT